MLVFDRHVVDACEGHNTGSKISLQDSAYCIYTSGSTGRPKGVEVSHLALATYARAAAALFPQKAQKECTFLASLSADLGYTSIYGALFSGNTVRLLDSQLKLETELLCEQLSAHPVDYLKVVPSHFQVLLESTDDYLWLPRCGIIFGGEALSTDLVNAVRNVAPQLSIINHYGPTETTVGAVFNDVSDTRLTDTVAIGRPFPGYRALVLDETQQAMPMGHKGELYIGGNACATGYLNNNADTDERFIQIDGVRFYRTGDAVHFNGEGQLVFLGRLDNQIKIRGYRIELEEIERTLKNIDTISEACVVVAGDKLSQHLVAFVHASQAIDSNSLKAQLAEYLPEAEVPSQFTPLTEFPRNASGKIDRAKLALKAAEWSQAVVSQSVQTSSGSIAEQLMMIWQSELKKPHLGMHDNYFDFGANSLLVIKVRKQVKAGLGFDIKLTDFFKYTTIASLAAFIDEGLAKAMAEPVVSMTPVAKPGLDKESRRTAQQRRKAARETM